jgi:methionine-rich copper-binding protein CopC
VNTPPLRIAAAITAAALALVIAGPTLAHADLVASDPEDGAVLATPPRSVELTFSEGLNAGKSSFQLIGPDGDVGTGAAPGDGSTSMVLENLVLAPGKYRIKWTAAAEDGHIERGSLGFTVSTATPEPAAPSPTPTSAPSTDAATTPTAAPTIATPSTPAPTPTPVAASTAATLSTVEGPANAAGTDVLVPIVAGLVLVALVGGFVLRRSRRA